MGFEIGWKTGRIHRVAILLWNMNAYLITGPVRGMICVLVEGNFTWLFNGQAKRTGKTGERNMGRLNSI